jgi:hypothetical protein
MDAQAIQLEVKEKEARGYNELEELFELQVSKYPETGTFIYIYIHMCFYT